jgi:hypothetical protein
MPTKNKLKKYKLLLTVGTFTTVFKDKKSLRSHKTDETKVFLKICGSGSVQIITDPNPNPGGLKTYGFYGPDPQHW